MAKGKVLVVRSRAAGAPPRQYLNETVVPAMALVDVGYKVVLATPDDTAEIT